MPTSLCPKMQVDELPAVNPNSISVFQNGGASGFQLAGVSGVGAQHFALFSPLPRYFRFFFLSQGVFLVELWPRVAAMDHPNCAFGFSGVILCEPRGSPRSLGSNPDAQLSRVFVYSLPGMCGNPRAVQRTL